MAAVASGLPVAKVTVVANKVRTDVDAEAIAEFCVQHSLALCGLVPWSEAVGDADRAPRPGDRLFRGGRAHRRGALVSGVPRQVGAGCHNLGRCSVS